MSKLHGPLTIGAGLALAALAGAGQAQPAQAPTASAANTALEIQDGVQISTLQKLTLSADNVQVLSLSANATIDAVTVVQVSSDPGRAYRIRLPHFVTIAGGALVEAVTARGTGGADATGQNSTIAIGGRNVIRVQGRLRVSPDLAGGSAAMPVSVDVE